MSERLQEWSMTLPCVTPSLRAQTLLRLPRDSEQAKGRSLQLELTMRIITQ